MRVKSSFPFSIYSLSSGINVQNNLSVVIGVCIRMMLIVYLHLSKSSANVIVTSFYLTRLVLCMAVWYEV